MAELLTVQEIAQTLKVKDQAVRNLIKDGQLPCFKINKKEIRVAKSDFDAWLEKQKKEV